MNILVAIEDKGLVLKPLIANRTHDALRLGCMISINEINETDGRMVSIVVTDCERSLEKECTILCTILADIIIENLQIRYLVRLLKQQYYYLSEKEQCDILVRVLKKLWYGTSGQKNEIIMCKSDIRQRLYGTIIENEAKTIVLEGFMRFRMKDCLAAWEKELAKNVEDYIRKKEYVEFVEILRLFVKIRIPRIRKVHICVDSDGEYVLLDERLCLLKCQFIGTNIDKDDALLSALVNIAPLNIVVHNKERFWDARIIETIKDVFGQRVEFSEDMI
ncbi:MAG: putative sporulation protein YtxC [Christensenellales bacterium]